MPPERFTGVGSDRPALLRFIVLSIGYPRLELDVLAQIKTLGEVLEVGEHCSLWGLRFSPLPLIDEFL